jgi:hypothetical protein
MRPQPSLPSLPFLLILLLLAFFHCTALSEMLKFDDLKPELALQGWIATQTGKGRAKWEVAADPTAPSPPNVLKQSGIATFPICIKSGTRLKDGYVEVKLKPLAGKEDQAGGVIWRFQDMDNYYVARANALENNLTIYHTLRGNRVAFKNAEIEVAGGKWHTLRVDFRANQFTVTFDGKRIIEAQDDTFSEPGGVGVWTKADSVTVFDDFSYGSP